MLCTGVYGEYIGWEYISKLYDLPIGDRGISMALRGISPEGFGNYQFPLASLGKESFNSKESDSVRNKHDMS